MFHPLITQVFVQLFFIQIVERIVLEVVKVGGGYKEMFLKPETG